MQSNTLNSSIAIAALMVPAFGTPTELILSDFDGTRSDAFKWTVPVQAIDFDGDGELEGKITATGYQVIAKYRLSRDEASFLLDEYRYLKAEIAVAPGDVTGAFLSLLVGFQTDITGEDVYEPAVGLAFSPLDYPEMPMEVKLEDISTQSIPDAREAIHAFASGQGSYFQIFLVQQTSKNAQSVVIFDDLLFSKD